MSNFRETAKLLVRRELQRHNLGIVRDPYISRLARSLHHLGVRHVLDVGANVGQFGALLRAAGYHGHIVSFEPLTQAFRQLASRSAGDPAWETRRSAVGAAAGEATIHIAGNSYSSSLKEMAAAHVKADPSSRYVGQETVPVTTVDSVVGEEGIDPGKCFLKVDTQGFEREVLTGALGSLGSLSCVQLELSYTILYEGQASHSELSNLMEDKGFEMFSMEPGIADLTTGQMLQSDVLFVRAAR